MLEVHNVYVFDFLLIACAVYSDVNTKKVILIIFFLWNRIGLVMEILIA